MNLQKKQTVEYTLTLSEDELVALGILSYMIESVTDYNDSFYSNLPQDIRNLIHESTVLPGVKGGGGWTSAPTVNLDKTDLDLSWRQVDS